MRIPRIVVALVGLALALTAATAYAKGHSLTGVVLTAAGHPASSLVVEVRSGDRERGRSPTGDDGRYYIGNLPAGTYTVVVKRSRGGDPLVQRQVEIDGDTRLELRLG